MKNNLGTIRNLIALTALAFAGVAGCATSPESSTELASKGTGADPGKGTGGAPGSGTCQDILAFGCEGLTGAKLEGCKADLQNAFNECVKVEACQAKRDAVAKLCAPKDVVCLAKADQVFTDCLGPSPGTGAPPKK